MKKQTFKISNKIIWSSSILVGVLMSIPKIAERQFNIYETIASFVLTTLFALFVWYYNIYTLPAYSSKDIAHGFSVKRLIKNLAMGFLMMFILASLQQFILTHLPFGATMVMVEVRGILISITFYMFIHLLYQSYHNQQVSLELERSKMDNLGAQYELLKQQVNPHFLFNSLNTLKYMVESRDENTVEFVLKLSDFYRFTLESRKLNLIKLEEELKILESYMFLLKARFEEGIDLSVDIDPKVQQTYIPPFTLQLLVENCIKHNVVSLERPLQIKIYSEGDFIVVQNQIQLKRTREASTGMGLENINQRYTHLLDKKITIQPNDTFFTIKLPVIHENSHY
jgi:two-component system, LytTR family, sensor kinase